jgi:hypothetical protein
MNTKKIRATTILSAQVAFFSILFYRIINETKAHVKGDEI